MPEPAPSILTFRIEGIGHAGETLDTWFVEAPDSRQALSRLSESLADLAETAGWSAYTLRDCADIRTTEVDAALAEAGVGLLHAALIGFGLWMMHCASRDRNKTMDADRVQADKRHKEAMDNSAKRHEEAMAALKELIARTVPPASPSGAA